MAFEERVARFVVDRPLLVLHGGRKLVTRTVNVSRGGCAAHWPEAFPESGEVAIKLRDGVFSPAIRGMVRWHASGGRSRRVAGLRLMPRGRAARDWSNLVCEAAGNGAAT